MGKRKENKKLRYCKTESLKEYVKEKKLKSVELEGSFMRLILT